MLFSLSLLLLVLIVLAVLGLIGQPGSPPLIIVAGLVLIVLYYFGRWMWGGFARVGTGFSRLLIAQGGDPPARGFSEQEALVIAGRIPEALDSYRSHLVAFPDDLDARVRLAALLVQSGDLPDAERQYREARTRNPGPRMALRISTGLATVHRATGDLVALRAELTECAERFADTASGEHARRELMALDAARDA